MDETTKVKDILDPSAMHRLLLDFALTASITRDAALTPVTMVGVLFNMAISTTCPPVTFV
jgi:hypothetical protein